MRRTVPEREPLLETERAVRVPLRQARPGVDGPVRRQHAGGDLGQPPRVAAAAHAAEAEPQFLGACRDADACRGGVAQDEELERGDRARVLQPGTRPVRLQCSAKRAWAAVIEIGDADHPSAAPAEARRSGALRSGEGGHLRGKRLRSAGHQEDEQGSATQPAHAAIANGGTVYSPQLVRAVETSDRCLGRIVMGRQRRKQREPDQCFRVDRAIGRHAERRVRLAAANGFHPELYRGGARSAGGGE